MTKKIITADDVIYASEGSSKELYFDENSIVTSIAREEAAKRGVSILFKNKVTKVAVDNIEAQNNAAVIVTSQINSSPISKKEVKSHSDFEIEALKNKLDILVSKFENVEKKYSSLAANTQTRDRDIDIARDRGTLMDIIIKNGLCVIPDIGIVETDIGILNGKIAFLSKDLICDAKKIYDAKHKCILPGIIDPHMHIGIFNDFELEVKSETRAALLGGVTTGGCFLSSPDSYINSYNIKKKIIKDYSHIDIKPHFVITNYKQLEEIPYYIKEYGITTFKLYMCGIPGLIPDVDDSFIMDVFEVLKESGHDCTVFIHAENPKLVERATKKHFGIGKGDLASWGKTHPGISEEEAVRRASFYANKIGVKVYFVHMSTIDSVDALYELKRQKAMGNIFAETTSPYLSISDKSDIGERGKMIPPLRDEKTQDALWKAINDGIIDTIGTDNTTISLGEKKVSEGMWNTIPGYPSVCTHLPSMLNYGINKGRISLETLVRVMCKNPAKIMGLYPQKGTIMVGSDADLVIIDLDKKMTVTPELVGTRSDFTLFDGEKLTGWPVMTIKNGKVAAIDMHLTDEFTSSKVL